MAEALALSGLADGPDGAVPVPLHPLRLRERGYNQAGLLARAVCSRTGLPLWEDALARTRYSASQLTRIREERLTALSGAFEADGAQVAGKRVLLVDDVLTTGATLLSCAETILRAAPDCRLSVAVLAVPQREFGLDG